MKVVNPDAVPAEPANSPLFTGGPVTRQTLLTPEMSNNFNLAVVISVPAPGTKCTSIAAIRHCLSRPARVSSPRKRARRLSAVGDVVHIPAEEKHWHGATPDSAFSHIALTTKGIRPRRWKSKSASARVYA
jgi:hypothetical protein